MRRQIGVATNKRKSSTVTYLLDAKLYTDVDMAASHAK